MNVPTDNVQIIQQKGKPAFAVIPWAEYQNLLVNSIQKPVEPEIYIPHEVVKATLRGDSPLKAWRENKEISQKELASRLGISQAAVAKNEKSAHPRTETLKKAAKALGISLEQLIF